MDRHEWKQVATLRSKQFDCGYCGSDVSSEKGYSCSVNDGRIIRTAHIYICHQCQRPTYFDLNDNQTPSKKAGKPVPSIDNADVKGLYDEARSAFSARAYTAATMSCRKLLMNLAVSKGAKKDLSFEQYVNYLAENNHIPAGTQDWVDAIRTQGNQANHEIRLFSEEEAEEILGFTEMLLRLVYEFPSRAKKYQKA